MFSGGSIPGVKHAWLTVYKFAVNEDANKPWDPADSSWKVVVLPTPVTIDITSTTGFVFGTAVEGLAVAPGTYNQIRLFLKSHDDTALPVAKDAANNALSYKAQLQYDDDTIVPIEIPNINSGLKLDRGVPITASQLTLLKTTFDAAHSIVRFNGGSSADSVTLRPRTYTYALNFQHTSTYIGGLDPSLVCGTQASGRAVSNCASDITVSLFAPSGDGLRMENWGTARVNALAANGDDDATFGIGPVTYTSYSDGGNDNPTHYDLMIKGKGMRTMLVRNIPVDLANANIGCSWSVDANDGANVKALIRPIIDSAPQTGVTLGAAPLAFRAGRVGLGFNLGGLFYEAYSANTDPFTGTLAAGALMTIPGSVGANMSVQVANYADIVSQAYCDSFKPVVANTVYPVVFSTQSVAAYRPFAVDTFYTDAKLAASPAYDYIGGATFGIESPTLYPGLNSVSVAVSVTGLPSTGYDKAWLVVSDVGGIVTTQDISGLLSSGGGATSVSLSSVPADVDTNSSATGVYEFSIRYWNSASPSNMKWARSSNFVNLRNGVTSGATTITVVH